MNKLSSLIITGGSDGLGRALGALCVSKNIRVICLSRTAPDYDAIHIKTDLTNPKDIDAAAKKIIDDNIDVDALVNCAGITTVEKANDISYDALEKTLGVNLLAPIYLTSKLFDHIVKNEADIMNVGSTVGTKAYAEQCAYGASKWGIRGASLNFAIELKNTPCRVIQLNTGGFFSNFMQKATTQNIDTESWSGSWMKPEDIAAFIIQILSLPKNMEVSEITLNRK